MIQAIRAYMASASMAEGLNNKNKRKGRSLLEEAFALHVPGKKSHIPERIAMLGISDSEMTETVTLAISSLLEKLDDQALELKTAKDQLREFESLVDVDTLAPIPNRRAFMRRLSWVISMSDRYNHPSSIVYFDLNGFKAINDTYGHAAGDMAIRHIAELLNHTKRESDFLARMGGDEFAIIMYYAAEKDAEKRGESIADKIRATPFMFNGQPIYIDTAVGFHAIAKGETPEEALHKADLSMFDHKRIQKDRVKAVDA